MESWNTVLNKFVVQAQTTDLRFATYPREFDEFLVRVSFGQGAPARVPWIAICTREMRVSKGIYPVYLYYKEFKTLVLAYGVSETEEYELHWPAEIMRDAKPVSALFDGKAARYQDSFVFKSYKVSVENDVVTFTDEDGRVVDDSLMNSDIETLLKYYRVVVAKEVEAPVSENAWSQGLFYMEKQLEDFILQNWESTELGKKYDLIVEDGEAMSQQYRTDIGPIDILARDKVTKDYVVIELKRAQTSDDTVGQLARYMGWVQENLNCKNVKGVIIAGAFDKRLKYALKVVPNAEVFIYEVDFRLKQFE